MLGGGKDKAVTAVLKALVLIEIVARLRIVLHVELKENVREQMLTVAPRTQVIAVDQLLIRQNARREADFVNRFDLSDRQTQRIYIAIIIKKIRRLL